MNTETTRRQTEKETEDIGDNLDNEHWDNQETNWKRNRRYRRQFR